MSELKKYDDVYDKVEEIFLKDHSLEENLKELNEYSKTFIGNNDRGMLRTILMCSKLYRNNPILKETFDTLADELRKDSPNGII